MRLGRERAAVAGTSESGSGAGAVRQHSYEEFTGLAETRLAQNTLDYLNIA